ncbi:DNA photolyase, FAD-binding/Cryptochrome [Trichoderma ceciliae]
MSGGRILVYFMRRDLRTADNPILHRLSTTNGRQGYTHLLPVYVLPPDQVEISGLLKDGETSPHPLAVAETSGNWKCGAQRVKFLAESVWNLKEKLESLDSGLVIRAGTFDDVLRGVVQHYAEYGDGPQVSAVWMTEDFSPEQKSEQEDISAACLELGIGFVLFRDQKYFMHDRDIPVQLVNDLPNVFANFWLPLEPLSEKPRKTLPLLAKSSLPPFPDYASLPPQNHPFTIPDTLEEIIQKLQEPVRLDLSFSDKLNIDGAALAHPFPGGETCAQERVRYVIKQGIASQYHNMLNELHESDRCHKLLPYLSLGCITARQVHEELVKLEAGTEPDLAQTEGFGRGHSPGTRAIRLELLYTDFTRLCTKKYGRKMFSLEGAGSRRSLGRTWRIPDARNATPDQRARALKVATYILQFQMGATGYGLIDAAMRQLLYTGYMSPRAQMLAASFFTQYAGIDWRHGVEWIASLSMDHDVSSHWYSWQHYARVGPDSRGVGVRESPAHVAFEYDPNGSFVRRWMPELQGLTKLSNLFQVATASPKLLKQLGLSHNVMVTHPVPPGTPDLTLPTQTRANQSPAIPRLRGVPRPQQFGPIPSQRPTIHPRFIPRIIPIPYSWFIPEPLQRPNPIPPQGSHVPPLPGLNPRPPPGFFLVLHPVYPGLAPVPYHLQNSQRSFARASQQNIQMPNPENLEFTLPFDEAPRAHLRDLQAPNGVLLGLQTPRAPRTPQAPQALQALRNLQAPRVSQALQALQTLQALQALQTPPAPPAPPAHQALQAP